MHHSAPSSLREVAESRIARLAIAARRLDLDELVIVECSMRLFGDGVGKSGAAQTDDRLQDVGKAAQVAELLLG